MNANKSKIGNTNNGLITIGITIRTTKYAKYAKGTNGRFNNLLSPGREERREMAVCLKNLGDLSELSERKNCLHRKITNTKYSLAETQRNAEYGNKLT